MKNVILILGCVMLVLGMGGKVYAEIGDTGTDLIYTPVAPCRIIDTRNAGGPIAGNATRNFLVAGTTGFESQGGHTGGCGIPDDATSVMINFIAVGGTTSGHLRAWPFGGTKPDASIVNFGPGQNIANGLIQSVCNPAVTTCPFDLSIFAASPVNVVADVTGYFRRFPKEKLTNGIQRVVYGTVLLNWIDSAWKYEVYSGAGYSVVTTQGGTNAPVAYIYFDSSWPSAPTCTVSPFQPQNYFNALCYWSHPDDYWGGVFSNMHVQCWTQSDVYRYPTSFSFMCVQ